MKLERILLAVGKYTICGKRCPKVKWIYVYYRPNEHNFHPAFVEPMLGRLGPPSSATNTAAVLYSNALARDVDARVTQCIIDRPIDAFMAWRGALVPEWGNFDTLRIAFEAGRPFDTFVSTRFPDASDAPSWLQTDDGKLGAPGTHAFVSDTLERSRALMRSDPTIAIGADSNPFDLDDGAVVDTASGSASSEDFGGVGGRANLSTHASSPFLSEIIDDDGTPLLLIEKDGGMFYVSRIINKSGKHATKLINSAGMQEYICAVQSEYGLTNEQVCDLRLSPDGNNQGYYVHFLVAIEVAAKCDVRYKVEINKLVTRYMVGDVTTEESKAVSMALARSVGITSRDGDVRALDPVEFVGFKRRVTMEMHDKMRLKEMQIADLEKRIELDHDTYDNMRHRREELEHQIKGLEVELASASPYYRSWKSIYQEMRDMGWEHEKRMRAMRDKVAERDQKIADLQLELQSGAEVE